MPEMGADKVNSKPPEDGKKITNIYVDKDGKVVVEYEKEEE